MPMRRITMVLVAHRLNRSTHKGEVPRDMGFPFPGDGWGIARS